MLIPDPHGRRAKNNFSMPPRKSGMTDLRFLFALCFASAITIGVIVYQLVGMLNGQA
jgi:hypothetical protein